MERDRSEKAIVWITLGDPAGIGPEIILKSMQNRKLQGKGQWVVIGSRAVLQKTQENLGKSFGWEVVREIPDLHRFPEVPIVYDLDNVEMNSWRPGQISASCGKAAYEYIEVAVQMAKRFPRSGVVTAPIHKNSLRFAGIELPGHTEIFESLCGVSGSLTMFVVDRLRVFFYTRHLSLKKAIEALESNKLAHTLSLVHKHLEKIGIRRPKIALAALNPHASDNGLFGTQEREILFPAVEMARNEKIDVFGPVPADSVFHQALQGRYDAVLSLFHDQGHIACKTYDFHRTVSVTLGLPFIRTSVDHGTAFDIAGQGIANCISMEEAISCCLELIL